MIAAVSAQPLLLYAQFEPSPVAPALKLSADGSRQLSVPRARRRLLQGPVQRHGTLYVASGSVACVRVGSIEAQSSGRL